MNAITKRIGPNPTKGRDFVVGDVHGCFRTLEQLLDRVAFVPGKDRLFSVGDLIDRGPHSIEAMGWLIDGRISAATMGNHENGLIAYLLNPARQYGAEPWWKDIKTADARLWIAILRTMPLAITVETSHGDVGIIHAGPVRRNWPTTVDALEAHEHEAMHVALLGGYVVHGSHWRGTPGSPVAGARAIVSGHYIRKQVHRDANWWRIDTGAGFPGGRVTVLQIDREPMVATTVDVVASEQVPDTSNTTSGETRT